VTKKEKQTMKSPNTTPHNWLAWAGLHSVALASALGLSVLGTANVTAGGDPGPGIALANSHAYGQTLTGWLETYWRWYYTGADPAHSTVGHVQLIPLPSGTQVGGSWTPADPAVLQGQLEITLSPGTPFVLPLFAWVWERYNGAPDDVPMADAVALRAAHPVLTIDGKKVLTDRNKAAFYVPNTVFDPIVIYPQPTSYGSIAGLSFQSLGVVGEPLSVGRHVIHLYESLVFQPGDTPVLPDGYGIIFDNTWVITVAEPPHNHKK